MRRNFAEILKEGKIDIENEYIKLYNLFYGKDIAPMEGMPSKRHPIGINGLLKGSRQDHPLLRNGNSHLRRHTMYPY